MYNERRRSGQVFGVTLYAAGGYGELLVKSAAFRRAVDYLYCSGLPNASNSSSGDSKRGSEEPAIV